jgi:hypothetical protein
MNNDISRLVMAACIDLGLDVRSYSGRAMYGQDCLGVDCSNPFQALAQIVVALAETGDDGMDAAEHFAREGAVKSDSMGCGSILYFPRLPWIDSDSEDAESGPWSVSEEEDVAANG